MSQIFRSFEANSQLYLTKMSGKSGQNGFSAVGILFSDRLLGIDDLVMLASKIYFLVSTMNAGFNFVVRLQILFPFSLNTFE